MLVLMFSLNLMIIVSVLENPVAPFFGLVDVTLAVEIYPKG